MNRSLRPRPGANCLSRGGRSKRHVPRTPASSPRTAVPARGRFGFEIDGFLGSASAESSSGAWRQRDGSRSVLFERLAGSGHIEASSHRRAVVGVVDFGLV